MGRDQTISPTMKPAQPSPLKLTLIMFWAVHVAALAGVVYLGFSWQWAALAVGIYFVRMFVVTGGYHRYFAHRSFKTSRCSSSCWRWARRRLRSAACLWWASQHRHHHKHSDTELDVHSPSRKGFWHSHVGWVVGTDQDETDLSLVADLARYPGAAIHGPTGINVLPRRCWRSPSCCSAACTASSGATSCRPSCSGTARSRSTRCRTCSASAATRPATTRATTGCWPSLTIGEGWHNNHHHYQSSARQGFRWWEIDVTYYVIKAVRARRPRLGRPRAPAPRGRGCGSEADDAGERRRRRVARRGAHARFSRLGRGAVRSGASCLTGLGPRTSGGRQHLLARAGARHFSGPRGPKPEAPKPEARTALRLGREAPG